MASITEHVGLRYRGKNPKIIEERRRATLFFSIQSQKIAQESKKTNDDVKRTAESTSAESHSFQFLNALLERLPNSVVTMLEKVSKKLSAAEREFMGNITRPMAAHHVINPLLVKLGISPTSAALLFFLGNIANTLGSRPSRSAGVPQGANVFVEGPLTDFPDRCANMERELFWNDLTPFTYCKEFFIVQEQHVRVGGLTYVRNMQGGDPRLAEMLWQEGVDLNHIKTALRQALNDPTIQDRFNVSNSAELAGRIGVPCVPSTGCPPLHIMNTALSRTSINGLSRESMTNFVNQFPNLTRFPTHEEMRFESIFPGMRAPSVEMQTPCPAQTTTVVPHPVNVACKTIFLGSVTMLIAVVVGQQIVDRCIRRNPVPRRQ